VNQPHTVVAAVVFVATVVGFACNSNVTAGPRKPSPIDGARAKAHVQALVDCGERPAGSAQLIKARDYLSGELTKLGLSPKVQTFTHPAAPNITFNNLYVEIPGTRKGDDRVLVLGSHYDTKITHGHPDEAHNFEFVGANDGGSSSGLLVELAGYFKNHPLACTLVCVWFDGEESIPFDWDDNRALFGSKHFRDSLKARAGNRDLSEYVPVMVLLDMVGNKDLAITRDDASAPELIAVVERTAGELGYGQYFFKTGWEVKDDHVPFKNLGVRVLDLIQFGPPTPPWWHKQNDTMDLISAESLAIVGHVVAEALPKIVAEHYK